jgi:hypothetical protein
MSYSETTLKKLFALSGNQCAFPGCQAPIVDDDIGIVVGEICHIKGKSPKGPRYDPKQSEAERNKYDNLLLMCDPHNKVVDHKDTRHKFPLEVLRDIKNKHEAKFRRKLIDPTHPGHFYFNLIDETRMDRFVNHFRNVEGSVITSQNQSGGQTAHQITNNFYNLGKSDKQGLVDRWLRMITESERKYKSGKEPGVSFAEIIQRQPDYLRLEPLLSSEALSALENDRLGKMPLIVGTVDGKKFNNPPDALKSILARELMRLQLLPDLSAAFVKQVERQLDIAFDKSGNGFVHPFRGESPDGRRQIVEWKLYRVAITSQTSAVTRLKIEHVHLAGGDEYSNLFLRVMGDPTVTEFRLHPGDPHLWDVVEKPDGSDWVMISHCVKTVPSLLVQVPCEFTITASSDHGLLSKLVQLDVDRSNNNELEFRLADPPASN